MKDCANLTCALKNCQAQGTGAILSLGRGHRTRWCPLRPRAVVLPFAVSFAAEVSSMNVRWLLFALPLVFVAGVVLAAQPRPNKQAANQNVAKAKDHLSAERKEKDAAQAAVSAAAAALAKIRAKGKEARAQIQAEHDATPEMKAAREQAEQNRQTHEQLSGPLLAKLKEGSEYQAAVAAFEKAQKAFKGSAKESDAEAARLTKQYKTAQAAIGNLEDATIDVDPKAKAARAARKETDDTLHALCQKRDAAIKQDPRLSALVTEFKTADAKLAEAKAKLAVKARELSEAERRLKAAEQATHKTQPKKQPAKRK